MRKKLVDCAKAFYGVAEGTPRHKHIVDTYNSYLPHPRGYELKTTDDWCAAFVSAMAILCDMTDIIPVECSCNEQIKLWKAMGRWQESDAHAPAFGDVVYYDWQDSGKGDNVGAADHVGIVVWSVGGNVLVIEGNKGDAVGYREINVNGRYIRGYGMPNYEAAENRTCSVELPVLKRGDYGEAVKALQTLLNLRGARLEVDGSFGPATTAATVVFGGSGIADGAVWNALLKGAEK